jgi:hypothetical protein
MWAAPVWVLTTDGQAWSADCAEATDVPGVDAHVVKLRVMIGRGDGWMRLLVTNEVPGGASLCPLHPVVPAVPRRQSVLLDSRSGMQLGTTARPPTSAGLACFIAAKVPATVARQEVSPDHLGVFDVNQHRPAMSRHSVSLPILPPRLAAGGERLGYEKVRCRSYGAWCARRKALPITCSAFGYL